tara:strand:+ start:50 stop:172 length:123 start_codon:yes stop_codon:yes gene_type:complete
MSKINYLNWDDERESKRIDKKLKKKRQIRENKKKKRKYKK